MIDENNLVIKQNCFVESIYDMSALELKLTLIAISRIAKDSNEFTSTIISVDEFTKITNTKKDGLYTYIKNICDNLGSKTLKIFDKEKNRYKVYPWFSKLEYYINDGMVEIKFNNEIKPFLLLLKDNFTSYALKYIINMKSKYSIKLYELLKQYETIGHRKFELDNLKSLLNLSDGYTQFCHLKSRVLEPAKKELEKTSDIKFTYKEEKKGRKIVALKFNITKAKDDENYNNYDKYKVIGMIQDEFYNKFNINLHHIDFISKHRIILLDILKTVKGVNQSKIKYPERWFNNVIIESTNKYDSSKICKLKDF
jgi:plasmid replication initiation protein